MGGTRSGEFYILKPRSVVQRKDIRPRQPRRPFRVRRSTIGCSIAQKGAAYPEDAAWLLRRSVAQIGFSVAQKGSAYLRRVQRSSEGCNLVQKVQRSS